jgi:hypothetical protein
MIRESNKEPEDLSSEAKKKILELHKRVENLVDRMFFVTKWMTNISLALLGFLVALLLQLKFNGTDIVSTLTILPLSTLTLSISVGFFLKLWYELIEISQEWINLKEEFLESFEINDEEANRIKEPPEDIERIKGAKLENLPLFWIGTQATLLIVSIVAVSIYLIKILFIF